MKLQISFDMSDLKQAVDVAKKVKDYADILEVGTILIHKYGIKAVEKFTQKFPDKDILADTKIIDRGIDITQIYAETKAKWLTVMAGTSNNVIHRVCSKAETYNIKVMLDIIDSDSPGQSALEAKSLGVDAILFHEAYDSRESLVFLDNLDMVKGNTDLPIFISSKIDKENISQIIETKPDGIVIGKSITDSPNPKAAAKFFHNLCTKV